MIRTFLSWLNKKIGSLLIEETGPELISTERVNEPLETPAGETQADYWKLTYSDGSVRKFLIWDPDKIDKIT